MSLTRKRLIWISVITVLVILGVILGRTTISSHKFYKIKSGSFKLIITTKGEISGKNAIAINLPNELTNRDLHIYQLKIKDMVKEGTAVKKGDWVATLDGAVITEQIQNNQIELDRWLANLNDAKIDTAIELTQLREAIKEFKFDLEYKKLELEQAKYESPAYQRKQQMEYDQTLRQMDKKQRDYELRKLHLKNRTGRTERQYNVYLRRDSLLKEGMAATQVTAPKDGMIMYVKHRWGRKLRIGDEVSRWMPTIATLPDMSVLVSETYVQEIDVTKIAIGDSVLVTIDALPDKKYKGTISKIANIGQEIPGYDTKVFRVFIDLEENDTQIKPAMTTNNDIIVEHLQNVIKIPRGCLFSQNGDTFVLLKEKGKIWKKKVETGLENDEEIVINSGLKENDKILYSAPEDMEEIAFYDEDNKNKLSTAIH